MKKALKAGRHGKNRITAVVDPSKLSVHQWPWPRVTSPDCFAKAMEVAFIAHGEGPLMEALKTFLSL